MSTDELYRQFCSAVIRHVVNRAPDAVVETVMGSLGSLVRCTVRVDRHELAIGAQDQAPRIAEVTMTFYHRRDRDRPNRFTVSHSPQFPSLLRLDAGPPLSIETVADEISTVFLRQAGRHDDKASQ